MEFKVGEVSFVQPSVLIGTINHYLNKSVQSNIAYTSATLWQEEKKRRRMVKNIITMIMIILKII